jgi:hypothetical protein
MVEHHNKPQNKLKMIVFANENEKLNHERVEDKVPTSLPLTVHRMYARNSSNLTSNFKSNRGVFGLK